MSTSEKLAESSGRDRRDSLVEAVSAVVLEEDLSPAEENSTTASISMMIGMFKKRLYEDLCGGFIDEDGKIMEDRLEKQVSLYSRIPNGKKRVVIMMLRGLVKEKIQFDKENE